MARIWMVDIAPTRVCNTLFFLWLGVLLLLGMSGCADPVKVIDFGMETTGGSEIDQGWGAWAL